MVSSFIYQNLLNCAVCILTHFLYVYLPSHWSHHLLLTLPSLYSVELSFFYLNKTLKVHHVCVSMCLLFVYFYGTSSVQNLFLLYVLQNALQLPSFCSLLLISLGRPYRTLALWSGFWSLVMKLFLNGVFIYRGVGIHPLLCIIPLIGFPIQYNASMSLIKKGLVWG